MKATRGDPGEDRSLWQLRRLAARAQAAVTAGKADRGARLLAADLAAAIAALKRKTIELDKELQASILRTKASAAYRLTSLRANPSERNRRMP
ncbi:MAG: hypothetical protein OJF62_000906 [Pseudolabrys sp.]|jgi:hypothetical protein|nr:hypothetical protein [Pseudolabrys sp.]